MMTSEDYTDEHAEYHEKLARLLMSVVRGA
jgi:hypothetical protein